MIIFPMKLVFKFVTNVAEKSKVFPLNYESRTSRYKNYLFGSYFQINFLSRVQRVFRLNKIKDFIFTNLI